MKNWLYRFSSTFEMLAEIIHKLEDGFIEINVKTKRKNVEGKWSMASIQHTIKYGSKETIRQQGEKGEGVKFLVDIMAENLKILMENNFQRQCLPLEKWKQTDPL